jgi:hypothetical protein
MRLGVIELLGHLILYAYNDPKLTQEQVVEKNLVFEYLLDHLYDVAAFCRGKVNTVMYFLYSCYVMSGLWLQTLQVWRTLCEEDAIPTDLLLQVLEKVQPCIIDKSSNTRKDAIKFMKTVLEHNPFAARVNIQFLNKLK